MNMEILITGNNGFIGSNLIKYLHNYSNIIGIDYPNDLLNTPLPKVDCVIHLAASTGVRESHKQPKEYFENNIKTTKRIFDHYKDTKILFASTSSVKELKSPYSMSKYACELIAPDNVVIMRFFTVWGNYNYRKDMLYGLAVENKLGYITEHKRDFTHVYDVCRAIKILINKGIGGETYEIGYGKPISNHEFLKQIGYNKILPIKVVEGESEITCADPTKMKELDW